MHPSLLFALFGIANAHLSRAFLARLFPEWRLPAMASVAIITVLMCAFELAHKRAFPNLYGSAVGLVAGGLLVETAISDVHRLALVAIAIASVVTVLFPSASRPPAPPPPPSANRAPPELSVMPEGAPSPAQPGTPVYSRRPSSALSPASNNINTPPSTVNTPSALAGDLVVGEGAADFNGDALLAAANACTATGNNSAAVNGEAYLATAVQVVRLMCTLGRAFEFGKASLEEHCAILKMRIEECAAAKAVATNEITLLDLVELSDKMGLSRLGKKARPAPRTILRLLWFIDFAVALCQGLGDDTGMELRVAAGDAYARTFGQAHPWLLRQSVRQGLRILPYRSAWEKAWGGSAKRCNQWAKALEPISARVWELLRNKGLSDLA